MDTTFMVFSDLHYDHMYDGDKRLKNTLDRMAITKADFVVNLGDLCNPIADNQPVLDAIKSLKLPIKHVIGNHDCDYNHKEQVLAFCEMANSYYSFQVNNCKMIVLDSCFMKVGKDYISYNKVRKKALQGQYPIIPPEELDWLRQELNTSCQNIVIYSHHSLENDFANRGIINRQEVNELLRSIKDQKKLVLAINGHDHADDLQLNEGIYYLGINGMSYMWFGDYVKRHDSLKTYYDKYPILDQALLYQDGMYATITIKDDGSFVVDGDETSYLTDTPESIGVGFHWNGRRLSAKISSGHYNT